MRFAVLLIFVLLASVSFEARREADAEVLAPGKYTGWIVQDRWGAVHLANGEFLLEFKGKAKDKALAWKDKPVTVDVTKMVDVRDTTQAIGEVGSITQAAPTYQGLLQVDLQVPEICPPDEERQHLDLFVRYTGKTMVKIESRRVMVIIRRLGAPLPDDATRRGQAFKATDDQETAWRSAGTSMHVLELGKQVRHRQVLRGFGGTFQSSGPFTYHTTLQMSLPPGAYEVFAVYESRNFSRAPAPRSGFVRLDVLGK